MNQRNIGIDILRIWMSFEVILCHFGHELRPCLITSILSKFRVLAVPIFMLISFYLFSKSLVPNCIDSKGLGRRLRRLYIPLVFWALVYFVVDRILVNCGCDVDEPTISMLFWQLVTGHSLNPPMWFNVSLAILTMFFFIIYRFFPQHSVRISIMLLVISFILQYSGLNALLFKGLPIELSYPCGRLVEMIPYAASGLLISNYFVDFQNKSMSVKSVIMLVLISISAFVVMTGLFSLHGSYSFDYGGIDLLLMSISILSLFIAFPFNKLPNFVKAIILILSKYCMGVYCVHILVGRLLVLHGCQVDSMLFPISIYLISLLVVILISKVPNNIIKTAVI